MHWPDPNINSSDTHLNFLMHQNQYRNSSDTNELSSKYETEGNKSSLMIQPLLKPKTSDDI
jgi:hypothetical protein